MSHLSTRRWIQTFLISIVILVLMVRNMKTVSIGSFSVFSDWEYGEALEGNEPVDSTTKNISIQESSPWPNATGPIETSSREAPNSTLSTATVLKDSKKRPRGGTNETQQGGILNSKIFHSTNPDNNTRDADDKSEALVPETFNDTIKLNFTSFLLQTNQSDGSNRNRLSEIKRDNPAAPTTRDAVVTSTSPRLKIPTPVFVVSLPKSGTTSVWKYFKCGNVRSAHLYAKLNATEAERFKDRPTGVLIGRCLLRNHDENVKHANETGSRIPKIPYFSQCGNYSVWTDTGFIKGKPATSCYYPAIEGLEDFYQSYPNGTLLFVTRNTTQWRISATKWSYGSLINRWKRCGLHGFVNKSAAGIEAFYEWHKQRVFTFAEEHPSLTWIHVSLEDTRTGTILEERTGIPASCWADCNPKTRKCNQIDESKK